VLSRFDAICDAVGQGPRTPVTLGDLAAERALSDIGDDAGVEQ
jgi:hypothetical protein